MTADAARDALVAHQWLTEPDFDQKGEVQRAERAIAPETTDTPLLAGAQGMHAWLSNDNGRPPIRAALVRFWIKSGLLRAPVPLTGARSLSPDTPRRSDLWTVAFLRAFADEAGDYLDLPFDMERAWLAARDGFVREGVVVEATHRAARRLFGLRTLGKKIRGCAAAKSARGGPRPRQAAFGTVPGARRRTARPASAGRPLRARPPSDCAALGAAMAHCHQVISETRRRLRALTPTDGDSSVGAMIAPSTCDRTP